MTWRPGDVVRLNDGRVIARRVGGGWVSLNMGLIDEWSEPLDIDEPILIARDGKPWLDEDEFRDVVRRAQFGEHLIASEDDMTSADLADEIRALLLEPRE